MNQRGVTLAELIVAMAVGVVVLLGVGSFYWQTVRTWNQSQAQAAIQRQGTLVQQEMARVILASSGLLPGTCGPTSGVTDSLPVQIPSGALPDPAPAGAAAALALSNGGYVCFYLNTASQIVECRFTSTASTTCIANSARNLLAGAPIPDAVLGALVQGTTMVFSSGGGVRSGGTSVDVDFALTAGQVGPLNFSARLTVRNG